MNIEELQKKNEELSKQNEALETKLNQQSVNSDIDKHFEGDGVHSGIILAIKSLANTRISHDNGQRTYEDADGNRVYSMGAWVRSVQEKDGIQLVSDDSKPSPQNTLKRSDMTIEEKLDYQSVHGEEKLLSLPA